MAIKLKACWNCGKRNEGEVCDLACLQAWAASKSLSEALPQAESEPEPVADTYVDNVVEVDGRYRLVVNVEHELWSDGPDGLRALDKRIQATGTLSLLEIVEYLGG